MTFEDIDFLIIGATKSATTWLQHSLQRDPAVFMPGPELHYFSREFQRGEQWYLKHFEKVAKPRLIGEKSNSYLENAEAACRIASVLPKVRLIAQLRNPVDRAYSDYCMMYRRGEVSRDIDAYLNPRLSQDTRLITAGFYYEQLRPFYDHFPADHVYVTFYETVVSNAPEHIAGVRRFLGLGRAGQIPAVEGRVKDKTLPMLDPRLRRWLKPFKPIAAPLRQMPLFRRLHGMLAAEISYNMMSESLKQRLVGHYAGDVENLGRLVGRDLSGWLAGKVSLDGSPSIFS